jgi:coenzyme F420 biosynthesis associated uncharacterized protein
MIDWRVARYIAGRVGGSPLERGPDEKLVQAICLDAEERVRGYTLMTAGPSAPVAEVVPRAEWVKANTLSMGPLLDAAIDGVGAKAGAASRAASKGKGPGVAVAATVTLEAGVMLGVLSRRVLGQYDIPLIPQINDPAPRLLFVGPNVEMASKSFGSGSSDDFLRWVAIHEMTHAVQFSAVPWLRGYIGGMAADLLDSLSDGQPTGRRPVADLARAAAGRAGRTLAGRDPFALMLSEEQHSIVNRMQAVMSVVEGHAEHVMDAAGAEVIPSLPRLRQAMARRRQAPNPLWRIVSRLMGLEMKMRQYEQGKIFCDAVAREAGPSGLLKVWESPAAIPTAEEILSPAKWLARVM